MGGDSCPEGCGFDSQYCILYGHFFTYIYCKNCNVSLKRRKNEREAGDGPFKKLIELKFRLNYRPSARLDGGEATGYVAAG